nr:unnamed protein product [Digitaria exilis]
MGVGWVDVLRSLLAPASRLGKQAEWLVVLLLLASNSSAGSCPFQRNKNHRDEAMRKNSLGCYVLGPGLLRREEEEDGAGGSRSASRVNGGRA